MGTVTNRSKKPFQSRITLYLTRQESVKPRDHLTESPNDRYTAVERRPGGLKDSSVLPDVRSVPEPLNIEFPIHQFNTEIPTLWVEGNAQTLSLPLPLLPNRLLVLGPNLNRPLHRRRRGTEPG